jgi:hypothetical protein
MFSAGLNTVDFTVSFLTVLYISMVKNSEKRYHAVEIIYVFPCFMSGGGAALVDYLLMVRFQAPNTA